MLRQPYTMDKLVGLVASVLPGTAMARDANAPAANWPGQLSASRLQP
jgi:hypothetical protein